MGRDYLTKYPSMQTTMSVIFNKTIGLNRVKVRGKGNEISGLNRGFLNRTKIQIVGNNNRVTIQKMSYLHNCSFTIYGNNNEIVIGERVRAEKGDFYIEDSDNKILIGDSTAICGYTHIAVTEGKKVIIGRDCLFSSDVIIRTGDSHSIVDMNGVRINPAMDVIIGDHVWLGNRTTVLKGSSVPSNSIVGTGAVVTKSFETGNVILAGSPAKVVKENINWLKERI
jgi:acetyltransferase-like isoleucine patch superfamily enzyme